MALGSSGLGQKEELDRSENDERHLSAQLGS